MVPFAWNIRLQMMCISVFGTLLLLMSRDIWALSTTTTSTTKISRKKAKNIAKQTTKAPTVTSTSSTSKSSFWRYSKPKSSKWDVRHTKSFKFTLYAPSLTSTSTSNNDNDNDGNESFDSVVLHKKSRESMQHVLGKGILWALFKDQYGYRCGSNADDNPNSIFIETPIFGEDQFIPDVVAFGDDETCGTAIPPIAKSMTCSNFFSPTQHPQPTFWGESGRMSIEKAATLARKYPNTHIVHLRCGHSINNMDIFEEIENHAVLPAFLHRSKPFTFAIFPHDPKSIVDENGIIQITHKDLLWRTARFDIDPNY